MRTVVVGCWVLVCVAACGGSGSSGDAVRLEIRPANSLLLRGEAARMRVVGFDADGKEIAVHATWSADDPSVVDVDDGVLHAQEVIGSTQIYASVDGLTARAFAYVAEPADGAVLYNDDDVTSPPARVPGVAKDTIVGSQLVLGLQRVAPGVGDILIPREDTPAAGMVVAVDGEQVTVEMVPLNQIFRELVYEQDIEAPLGNADDYRVDGQSAFGLGPFDCETDAAVSIPAPTFSTPTIDPIVTWRGRLEIRNFAVEFVRIAAEVGAILEFGGSYEIPASFKGKLECEWILWRIPIEGVGSPLSWLARPTLPVGLGFSMEGEVRADLFRVAVKGKSRERAAIGSKIYTGVEWDPQNGFATILEQEDFNDFELDIDVPGLEQGPRFVADGRIYVTSGLDLTPRVSFSSNSSLEFLDFDLGLSQKGDFASIATQADNASYASSYDLTGFVRLDAGKDIVKAINALGFEGDPSGFEGTSNPIAISPTGTLGVPGGGAPAGQELTLTVSLMNTDYLADFPLLSFYNVEYVEIWRKTDSGWELLDQQNAAEGQTQFMFTWTPTEADIGPVTLAPFVTTKLVPIIPLELAGDARRSFDVVAAATGKGILINGWSSTAQVYLYDPDTGDSTPISTTGAVITPSFSPPTATGPLRVVWEANKSYFISTLGGGGTVMGTAMTSIDSFYHWSPDGEALVTAAKLSSTQPETSLYVVDASTGGYTPIVASAGEAGPWSSSGRIAYIDPGGVLHIVDSDGQNDVATADYGTPAMWTPDETEILTDYCTLVTEAGNSRAAPWPCQFARVAFSPDGTQVASLGTAGAPTELIVSNFDGSGTPVTVATDVAASYGKGVAFSPDGSQVAYTCTGSSSVASVCVANTDGSGSTELPLPQGTTFAVIEGPPGSSLWR